MHLTTVDPGAVTLDSEAVPAITETTLALLLFADPSTIGLRELRCDALVPTRLLLSACR